MSATGGIHRLITRRIPKGFFEAPLRPSGAGISRPCQTDRVTSFRKDAFPMSFPSLNRKMEVIPMQKKMKLSAMLLAMLLMLSVTAGAMSIQPRWNVTTKCNPALSFSGTTAYCTADVSAINGTNISGTMTLYRVSSINQVQVGSWSFSGTTRVYTTETCSVTKGETYKLVVNVNASGSGGTDKITLDTTKTC